jgi:hypothetical protein
MPKPKTEAAEYVQTAVRLPPEIFRALREGAKAADRPLNRQVIRMLRKALELPEPDEASEDEPVGTAP